MVHNKILFRLGLLSKATSASCPEGHSIMKGVASGRALDA